MYEVDLVGGPEDGHTYVRTDLPPYLYFPYFPEPAGLLEGPHEPTDPWTLAYATPKLVYRHITHGLYWYQGISE